MKKRLYVLLTALSLLVLCIAPCQRLVIDDGGIGKESDLMIQEAKRNTP